MRECTNRANTARTRDGETGRKSQEKNSTTQRRAGHTITHSRTHLLDTSSVYSTLECSCCSTHAPEYEPNSREIPYQYQTHTHTHSRIDTQTVVAPTPAQQDGCSEQSAGELWIYVGLRGQLTHRRQCGGDLAEHQLHGQRGGKY